MGVLGLWQIIDSVGHPIKLEGLEGKQLGVDANLWLYKFIRGFREKDNAANLDAHKLGLFNRISKLLFYKIKPIFVFDGPAPVLKRRTLERRKDIRNKEYTKVQESAIKLLSEQLKAQYPNFNIEELKIKLPNLKSHNLVLAEKLTDEDRELFYLPPEDINLIKEDDEFNSDEDYFSIPPTQSSQNIKNESTSKEITNDTIYIIDSDEEYDNHYLPKTSIKSEIDINSREFDTLPPEIRYEMLQDIKEEKRRIKRAASMPEDAESFSDFQLRRLKSKRLIQEKIERCEKEIQVNYTGEIAGNTIQSFRVQSDPTSTMLYGRIGKEQNIQPAQQVYVNDDSAPVLKERSLVRREDIINKEYTETQESAIKLLSEELESQNPNSNIEELKIKSPNLKSHNSVLAEKLTDEDRELFYLPPEDINLINEHDEYESTQNIKKKSTSKEIINETVYISDSDEDSDKRIEPAIDTNSKEFETLPPEIRNEMLHDNREEKKSKRATSMPEDAESFSDFQLKRLKSKTLIEEKIGKFEKEIQMNHNGDIAGNTTQSEPTSTMLYDKRIEVDGKEQISEKEQEEDREEESNIQPFQVQSETTSTILYDRRIETHEIEKEQDSEKEEEKNREKDNEQIIEPTQQVIYILDDSTKNDEKDKELNYAGEIVGNTTQSDPTSTMLYDKGIEVDGKEQISEKEQEKDRKEDNKEEQTIQLPQQVVYVQHESIKNSRTTAKVTNKIVDEAKELLKLFGVPFIDAPGEAEAQLALLEQLKLTEGTITDDSDVWLFGAQNVYRHFFSDDKYVLQYKMSEIDFHIRMNRTNLICFAMLVGSDYTDGIKNVGPVTALEILSEFPGDGIEPLIKFKNWREQYERTKRGRIPGSKKRESFLKFNLPEDFPSRVVFDGYTRPSADMSTEKFQWGIPELDELREYARRNFGWDTKKIDDKLLPVMKKVNERKTQPTIDSFFFKRLETQNPELFRSKRINEALNKIQLTKTTSSSQELKQQDEDEQQDVVILTESEGSDCDDVEVAGNSKSRANKNKGHKSIPSTRTGSRNTNRKQQKRKPLSKKSKEPELTTTSTTRETRRRKVNK